MSINLETMKARHAALERIGFRRTSNGLAYRQNGMLLVPKRRWCVLETLAPAGSDPLADSWGKPALWKFVSGRQPGELQREFHLPMEVLNLRDMAEDHEADGTETIRSCIEWALATSRGESPAGWSPPPREQLDSWIPDVGLTVQDGPIIRQGSIAYAPDRLALRFSIVPDVSPGLTESRLGLMRDLLIDGQNRWRMVRLGLTGSAGRQAVEAQVDLTGAPSVVLETLFKISLDALRWVVRWMVWSAAFLADAHVECRVWEGYQSGRGPRKGDGQS